MKKIILILVILTTFFLTGCLKDTEAPIITASNQVSIIVDSQEPDWSKYFSVEDDKDGKIQVNANMLTNNVDISTVGSYTVTLKVEDRAGNISIKTIVVNIIYEPTEFIFENINNT